MEFGVRLQYIIRDVIPARDLIETTQQLLEIDSILYKHLRTFWGHEILDTNGTIVWIVNANVSLTRNCQYSALTLVSQVRPL